MTSPRSRRLAKQVDVVLLSMPFGPVFGPSLGLGLLKAQLARRGVSCRVRHFTIAFAELIGEPVYERIAISDELTVREMAGEWLFSGALFEQSAADVQDYLARILGARDRGRPAATPRRDSLVDTLLRARAKAGPFLDRCAEEVAAWRPRVVGFTSVFQQHVASLAVTERIRRLCPEVFVVGGGANCEGLMGAETLRQFAWLDAVVSGEGDEVFPRLAEQVLTGVPPEPAPGLRLRTSIDDDFAHGRFESARPVRNLDALPVPDFDDYFAEFRRSRFHRDWQPQLFVETSRGCWWGEKSHCTFCGLNGATMAYRSKTPDRALEELTALAGRFPGSDLQVVDNILDMKYLKTLLPALAERKVDFGLFYETKSNLKKEHIRVMRAAGVRMIQPGIESFSDEVLRLMRKGVSGLQNVQVLKWCREYGLQPIWNVLWGTPGEPAEAYDEMARLVPLLTHLPPPAGSIGLRLDRFSPNFMTPDVHGLRNLRPFPVYSHVYDLPAAALHNLAYYFDFDADRPQRTGYEVPLLAAIDRWQRCHARSDLFSVDRGDVLLVCDLRTGRPSRVTALRGYERLTWLRCDAVCSEDQLLDEAASRGGESCRPEDVRALLARLVALGLLLKVGPRYLSLAVPLGEHQPAPAVMRRFDALARRSGRITRRRGWRPRTNLTVGDFSFDGQGIPAVGC